MTKILVIGPTDKDSFADNVGDSLYRMGHDIRMTGPARPRSKNRRIQNAFSVFGERIPVLDERLQKHLVTAEREFLPDVVLTLDRTIQPSVVKRLKANGARIALWFPDAVSNLGRHDLFLAPYDQLFFKNPSLVEQLTKIHGLPVTYMPEAANSVWHKSTERYGEDEVIVVAGNIHPTRAILLERMLEAGLPLRIYGPKPSSWMDFPLLNRAHTGRFITRQEKADTFRRARLVLNNLHPAEYAGSNCRLFEATASGAVVLTETRRGLDNLFAVGEEVLTFSSFEELVSQSTALLADRAIGEQIANKAAVRSHRDHTYETRLKEILPYLA